MQKVPSDFVLKLSKVISNFFNPIVSLLIYYIYYSISNLGTKEALVYILPLLGMVVVPIIYWISSNVKKGKYTNMDVSNQRQRRSLYYFIIVVLLVYQLYHYLRFKGIDMLVLFLFILLVVLHFSNYLIKSSMHTSINIFVAALFYSQNHCLGWAWLGIALLVGITRIILKRHTVAEVFSGAAISFLVSISYLYCIN